MNKVFYPDSILIIGVSESANNLARAIADNIIQLNYKGKLLLAGRNPGTIEGIPIITDMAEVPENIDLAVILTPAATVPSYLEACGKKGIKFAIIESGGFSELSEEGRALERQLVEVARQYGMRFVGPNCIGLTNTFTGINTLFVKNYPDELMPGRISLLAQSGGVVLTCSDILAAGGLGLGKSISVGNKVDYKEADYLEYFEKDDDTDIIILYLESIDDGRGLLNAANAGNKPVIVYKSNTSPASSQIAASHTAALANDDRIVDQAFRQYGFARAHTFREMVQLGKGFALPPMLGNRLAVVSRSGGHAIVSADLANEFGFELPEYPENIIEIAKKYMRAAVMTAANPLDLGTVFDFNSYPVIIEAALSSQRFDGALLIFNYRRDTIPTARDIAEKLEKISKEYNKPVALCYFCEMQEIAYLERNLGFPVFSEVYDAMVALAASRTYHNFLVKREHKQKNKPPEIQVPADACEKARGILRRAKNQNPTTADALEICQAYGMNVAPYFLVSDATEAIKHAENLGFPLVLKAVSGEIIHKSDIGGVITGIRSSTELADAFNQIHSSLRKSGITTDVDFLLQKMAVSGREIILGGKTDRGFGSVILLGLGGIFVEVFNDFSLRISPIDHDDALEMISDLRGKKLLVGTRGQKPSDLIAITDTLQKLSKLLEDLPEISEIDINPLMAMEVGAQVVDARIMLK